MESRAVRSALMRLIGSLPCLLPSALAQGAGESAAMTPAPTNRVDVPLSVRQNLGITFVKVERRSVAKTLRIPGRFELKPTGRRDYVAPLRGRIELLVEQYQLVAAGDPLFRIHSPEWGTLKAEMIEAQLAGETMRRQLDAHERHQRAVQQRMDLWKTRLEHLEALHASGGANRGELLEARSNFADAEADLAESSEKWEELKRDAIPLVSVDEAGNRRLQAAIEKAAILLGTSPEALLADDGGNPAWKTLDALEVKAGDDGVVESLAATQGGIADSLAPVLSVVNPAAIRFRATALQSDTSRIAEGALVAVAPMDSASAAVPLSGRISYALEANPANRTIDLIANLDDMKEAAWARPGVAGVAEVIIAGGGPPELAIPQRAVIQDGLQRILFRRDPKNPDSVIRMEADAGIADGRWVEILSGLAEGEEVVMGGIYELMLGSSTDGTRQEGGHFHSDGSFHEAH